MSELLLTIINKMIANHFFTIEGEDRWFYQANGFFVKRWDGETFCNYLKNQNVDEDIIDIIRRDIAYICDALPEASKTVKSHQKP